MTCKRFWRATDQTTAMDDEICRRPCLSPVALLVYRFQQQQQKRNRLLSRVAWMWLMRRANRMKRFVTSLSLHACMVPLRLCVLCLLSPPITNNLRNALFNKRSEKDYCETWPIFSKQNPERDAWRRIAETLGSTCERNWKWSHVNVCHMIRSKYL